ncbi:MAG: relaxase domain-containing protein [Opitutae bacterium]|nr:relaxase domain-containing protein [Opitutae bacterium]
MAKIKDGATYLGRHLASNDYYCENEAVIGHWQGRAAERLGLHGEIRAGDEAFERLRNNQHPEDGHKLTPRNSAERVKFFDFQCSAQKSVSIMAVTMGDARLLIAHDRAAAVAFAELEKFAACQANTMFVRQNHVTGNAAAAVFRHTASRALDPQVHTHFVVANATWDAATKSWKALTEYEMLRAIRYGGKTYQNELAKECRALGYDITTARDARGTITGFEIAGVSEEVRARFSKRRADIERGIAMFEKKHGRAPTTAEIHAITVESRNAKLAEITTPEVLAAQRAQLTPREWNELTAIKARAETRGIAEPSPTRERESLRLAIGHAFERRSVVTGHEILAEALNQNLGHLDLDRLQVQATKSPLVALDERTWLHGVFATPRGLTQERWAVEFIDRTKDKFPILSRADPAQMEKLSSEQRRAVAELLTTRDQVVCLRGAAGVGKSTVLTQLHTALVADGHTVFVCAPTSSAADTLRRDGIANATTVSGFLQNVAPRDISARAVFVVDEAGLTSNSQGAEVLQLAERHGARVVFLGDSRQHTSVEAGDFLRILEAHAPLHRVDLSDIRRQTMREYRDAVRLMADGSAREGLEQLDRIGWVHEGKAEYLRAAVDDYLRVSGNGERLDNVLAVTPTWEENHAFTNTLRVELKSRGVLRDGSSVCAHEPLPWTRTQLARAKNYSPGLVVTFNGRCVGFARGEFAEVARVTGEQVWIAGRDGEKELPLRSDAFSVARPHTMEVCIGDKLLMRANDRSSGLVNGQTLTVAAMRENVIETVEGRQIDTQKFRQFTHGFAVTSHRSQSKTTDHVIVAAAKLDAKSAYVACSRGRLNCSVHTPDKAALLERLPAGTRDAALDFNPPAATIERAGAWLKAEHNLSARAERVATAAQALQQPWWRDVMRGVAEWSRRILPGARVDRGEERNDPNRAHA